MLILTAQNMTGEGKLETNGLANYMVWIGVVHRQIWAGPVNGHIRAKGASELLRKIADAMDKEESEPLRDGPVEEALMRMRKAAPRCPRCTSQKLTCENGCTWEIKS
jgi:hypothetical protein